VSILPRLNRRLVLEAPIRTPDGLGGWGESWVALGSLWAEIEAGELRPADRPGAAVGRRPLRITLRGAPPGAPSRPIPGQRLREGSRLYPIAAVTEADPDGRFLLCQAEEEAAL
jgi:head-tail adaptor